MRTENTDYHEIMDSWKPKKSDYDSERAKDLTWLSKKNHFFKNFINGYNCFDSDALPKSKQKKGVKVPKKRINKNPLNKFLFEIRQIWISSIKWTFFEKHFSDCFVNEKMRAKCMTKETELIEKLG